MTVTYNWLHIPTGKQGTTNLDVLAGSLGRAWEQLDALLNTWNARAPGLWQYWR